MAAGSYHTVDMAAACERGELSSCRLLGELLAESGDVAASAGAYAAGCDSLVTDVEACDRVGALRAWLAK